MADLKVLIIESDEFLRQAISSEIEGMEGVSLAGSTDDPVTGQRLATQQRPDVVLLEVPEQADSALELAEWLRVEQPETMVLGASASVPADLMRLAMRAGVQDLLPRPVDPGQLKIALDHALELRARRLRSQVRRGQVTAVFGVSGGIGTTTIATNMAVELATHDEDEPVVLADFDLSMGSVPCFLDLPPSRGFHQVLADMEKVDGEGLRQLLPRHDSGLYMLAGPQGLEDLDGITADQVTRSLEYCRTSFRHVVVDAGHGFDERRIELLDRSDLVLLVVQLNVASLHRARRAVEALNQLGYPEEQVKIIANRVSRASGVSVDDVTSSVGRAVAFGIPSDYKSVIEAIDAGLPLTAGKGSSRVATSIRSLTNELVAAPVSDELLPTGVVVPSPAQVAGKSNGRGTSSGPISRLLASLKPAPSPRTNGGSPPPAKRKGKRARVSSNKRQRTGPISRLLSSLSAARS